MSNDAIIKELDRIITQSKSVIDSAERLRGSLEQFSAPAPKGGKVSKVAIDVREIVKKRNDKIIKLNRYDRKVGNG